MNSQISASSTQTSLILPLNQLQKPCDRFLSSLVDERLGQKERVLYEQTLWNEVKKVKSSSDHSLFIYLTGFYLTVLFQIKKDRRSSEKNEQIQYNVLIRLGDLSRYMERLDTAEYYYSNARNLFPNFGHAYNQLGLLTKPENCYKCCYYYARAAKSIDKPLSSIAVSNLRMAVTKYDCEILNQVLEQQTQETVLADSPKKDSRLPKTPIDWFFVIVVAIYADNIAPVAKPFLLFVNEKLGNQAYNNEQTDQLSIWPDCELASYLLLATLDILLDWLRIGSRSKEIRNNVNQQLRLVKMCLDNLNRRANLSNGSSESSLSCNGSIISKTFSSPDLIMNKLNRTPPGLKLPAQRTVCSLGSGLSTTSVNKPAYPGLPHDDVLIGFSPLESVHKNVIFSRGEAGNKARLAQIQKFESESDSKNTFLQPEQLRQMMARLNCKLNAFEITSTRKQTRNIALESILSKMNRFDEAA